MIFFSAFLSFFYWKDTSRKLPQWNSLSFSFVLLFFATTLVEYFCQFIHFPLIWMVKPFLSLFCKKTLPFVVIINIWLTQIFWLCSWIIERIFYYYYWIIASIVLIVWNCQFTLHLRFLVLIIDCVYCL